MGNLDVLRDLQARVTALETQLGNTPGVDTLQSNVLTVGTDGTIGAAFTGLVNALGLILPATAAKGTTDRIVWQRASDAAAAADIYGTAPGGGVGALVLEALPIDGGTETAQLTLLSRSAASSIGVGFAPGTVGATIIDAAGDSSFVQAAGGARQLAIDAGTAILGFAASTTSANTVVPHRLGRAPVAILATSYSAPGFGQIVTPNPFAATNANFLLNGSVPAAYTGNLTVSWLAIG